MHIAVLPLAGDGDHVDGLFCTRLLSFGAPDAQSEIARPPVAPSQDKGDRCKHRDNRDRNHDAVNRHNNLHNQWKLFKPFESPAR
jgi:hypothetical protein